MLLLYFCCTFAVLLLCFCWAVWCCAALGCAGRCVPLLPCNLHGSLPCLSILPTTLALAQLAANFADTFVMQVTISRPCPAEDTYPTCIRDSWPTKAQKIIETCGSLPTSMGRRSMVSTIVGN